MLWFALLVPVLLSFFAYLKYHREITIGELILPTVISFLFIVISYFTLKSVNMTDIEYNGEIVIAAKYYEPWETWVHKTCSYTTCTGSGKTRHCTTHHYDCSYCDYNSEYYEVITDRGNKKIISKEKYNILLRQWSAKPEFIELDRHINYHGSCGKDGDAYIIKWDQKIETSEAFVSEHEFKNIVKVTHSAFKFSEISNGEADTIGLYHYPSFYDYYKQPAILGTCRFPIHNAPLLQKKLEYLNGYLGTRNKVKVFTLLFKNKPIDIAFKQEAYWEGGNQNELVVCIGLKDNLEIDWVKPFSWCDNKRILIDTREDIAELKTFKGDSIYNIYLNNIPKYFHYKSFKDFNYLSFEPTIGQILFVYIGTIVISIITLFFGINFDIFNTENKYY